MKNILIATVLVFLISAVSLKAQWIHLNSRTTEHLYDVYFPTADTGYVVGYNGTILKTSDAGINWSTLNTHSAITLNSVHFIDGYTGLAVGTNGTILHTKDGGSSWTIDSINVNYRFNEIYFLNSSIGFIAGSHIVDPVLLKTTDGGVNWNMVNILDSVASDFPLNSVHFPTPDTGYAVFRSGVIRSIDGGDNWSLLINYVGGTDSIFPFSILESCYFTDANTGYIGGWYNPALWKTTDGANSWTNLGNSSTGSFQLHSIYFPGKDTGYAAGWYGEIYSTTNAGNTWTTQTIGTDNFYSIHFTDLITGYAVGDNGTIVKTINGGLSNSESPAPAPWVEIFPNPSAGTFHIKFAGGVELEAIDLIDFKGNNVKSISKDADVLELSAVARGSYVLKIRTTDGHFVKKIILQ